MKISRTRTPPTTPLKALVSVHGNVATPESPNQIDDFVRNGWGSTFWGKNSTTHWFHLPFSAPVLLEGIKPTLTRVFLSFHNTSRSPITAVHLYDGPKLLHAFDNLNLFGDHSREITQANTFLLKKPAALSHGLGISVNVNFPQSALWILFTSAMAEFRA